MTNRSQPSDFIKPIAGLAYYVPGRTGPWKNVTPAMRFEGHYIPEPNSGCWLWLGLTNQFGYGRMMINRRLYLAHRISYEIHTGPIPDGLTIDHLCRVRCCVNPDHLEAVTGAENTRRAAATETHCKWGHPWNEKNTWMNGAWRFCRQCNADRQRATQIRKAIRALEASV